MGELIDLACVVLLTWATGHDYFRCDLLVRLDHPQRSEVHCLLLWRCQRDGQSHIGQWGPSPTNVALTTLQYSWINSTLRHSTAERGLVISSMMTAGYCTYIWVSSIFAR